MENSYLNRIEKRQLSVSVLVYGPVSLQPVELHHGCMPMHQLIREGRLNVMAFLLEARENGKQRILILKSQYGQAKHANCCNSCKFIIIIIIHEVVALQEMPWPIFFQFFLVQQLSHHGLNIFFRGTKMHQH